MESCKDPKIEALDEGNELRRLTQQLLHNAMESENLSNRIHTRLLREAMKDGIIIDSIQAGSGICRHVISGSVETDHPYFEDLILRDDWTYVAEEDANGLRNQEVSVLDVYSPARLTHDDISRETRTIISFTTVLEGDTEPTHFIGRLENIDWHPVTIDEELATTTPS